MLYKDDELVIVLGCSHVLRPRLKRRLKAQSGQMGFNIQKQVVLLIELVVYWIIPSLPVTSGTVGAHSFSHQPT